MAEPLLLGSASPRRAELLGRLGVAFEVAAASVDEDGLADDDIEASVERIARAKFTAFGGPWRGRRLLTADTMVGGAGRVLGKPSSARDALDTLAALSGQALTIVSAVCVGSVSEAPRCRTVTTTVLLRPLSRSEIEAYVATGAAADKAGGLELQDRAASFVDSVDGCWSNVVGLPLCAVGELLGSSGARCSGRDCGAGGRE